MQNAGIPAISPVHSDNEMDFQLRRRANLTVVPLLEGEECVSLDLVSEEEGQTTAAAQHHSVGKPPSAARAAAWSRAPSLPAGGAAGAEAAAVLRLGAGRELTSTIVADVDLLSDDEEGIVDDDLHLASLADSGGHSSAEKARASVAGQHGINSNAGEPDDVPASSAAHKAVKWDPQDKRFHFQVRRPTGEIVCFQTTVKAASGSQAEAERFARLCYVMLEGGASKEVVKTYRASLYARLSELVFQGKPLPPPRPVLPAGPVRPPSLSKAKLPLRIANKDFCEVCQSGGKLLLCDKCPRAFHAKCIQHIVQRETLERGSDWICPVCSQGTDILRGVKADQLSPESMESRMVEFRRHDNKQRRANARRRDCFLASRLHLIDAFATKAALTRVRRTSTDQGVSMLMIGARVRVVGKDGDPYLAVVLAHTSTTCYLVADEATKAEANVDRSRIALLDNAPMSVDGLGAAAGEATGLEAEPDLLQYAHKPIMAEGTALKDYQVAGANWLIRSFYNLCGGMLADDMGLGKTVQALACLSYLRSAGAARGAALVVAPLSCVGNWVREAKRFVPHLSIAKLCGVVRERERALDEDEVWYGMKDVVVTTYETLVSTADFFASRCWSLLILDEAHRIKGQTSQVRESLDAVPCAGRILLTGTPLQNNLGELFALLRFLWPDVLARESELFSGAVQLPSALLERQDHVLQEAKVDAPMVGLIRSMLGLLMLRRKKQDVIRLPPKVLRDVWLPPSPAQAKWQRLLCRCRAEASRRGGLGALVKFFFRHRVLSDHPRCLVSSQEDLAELRSYAELGAAHLAELLGGPAMSEEVVAQSSKLMFLDLFLKHLHAQNMGLCPSWRRAYEARQRHSRGEPCKTASAWLEGIDTTLLLEEMCPWSPCGKAATGAHGQGDSMPHPHKVLIFSQFQATLDLLGAFCAWRGWRALRLDGSTNKTLRELDIRDFNSCEEDFFVYLLSTRAGGLGVNLVGANHVVLFDQDWNPHIDKQAVDRAHRIGQARAVNVYRLIQEWGVEERLVHKQEQKLKLEECVIHAGTHEGESGSTMQERMKASDLLQLLRHGEETMRHFLGESIAGQPLQHLLERGHRPLPVPDVAIGPEEELQGLGSVVDVTIEEDARMPVQRSGPYPVAPASAASQVTGSSPGRVEKQPEVVVRTSSGRLVRRPPSMGSSTVSAPIRQLKRAVTLDHETMCFACRSDAEPDTFCDVCPKSYHAACLSPSICPVGTRGRWSCGWHACAECSRTRHASGGILIHCLTCPTALCPECFPPDFRRVHPPAAFWSHLRRLGWHVSGETMVLFQCNACRAAEEERKVQAMHAEDLAARDHGRREAALVERQRLAAVKKRQEEEEVNSQMRQLLREHERTLLQRDFQAAHSRLVRGLEQLWPPFFRASWLAWCQGPKAAAPAGLARRLELAEPVPLCKNCSLPSHVSRACPFPAERVPQPRTLDRGSTPSHGASLCGLCGGTSHRRIQCANLTQEQRSEYQTRLSAVGRLTAALRDVASLAEPSPTTSGCDLPALGSAAAELQAARQRVAARVLEVVCEVMRREGLQDWIVEDPPVPLQCVVPEAPGHKAACRKRVFMKLSSAPRQQGKRHGKRPPVRLPHKDKRDHPARKSWPGAAQGAAPNQSTGGPARHSSVRKRPAMLSSTQMVMKRTRPQLPQ